MLTADGERALGCNMQFDSAGLINGLPLKLRPITSAALGSSAHAISPSGQANSSPVRSWFLQKRSVTSPATLYCTAAWQWFASKSGDLNPGLGLHANSTTAYLCT